MIIYKTIVRITRLRLDFDQLWVCSNIFDFTLNLEKDLLPQVTYLMTLFSRSDSNDFCQTWCLKARVNSDAYDWPLSALQALWTIWQLLRTISPQSLAYALEAVQKSCSGPNIDRFICVNIFDHSLQRLFLTPLFSIEARQKPVAQCVDLGRHVPLVNALDWNKKSDKMWTEHDCERESVKILL